MNEFLTTPIEKIPVYLTDKDLSRLTGITRETFQRWRSKGEKKRCKKEGPPFLNIAGRVYYHRDQVLEYFAPTKR